MMCNQKEECGTVTDSVVLGYLLSQLQSVDALSVLQVSLCADYMSVVVCFVFAELNSH